MERPIVIELNLFLPDDLYTVMVWCGVEVGSFNAPDTTSESFLDVVRILVESPKVSTRRGVYDKGVGFKVFNRPSLVIVDLVSGAVVMKRASVIVD